MGSFAAKAALLGVAAAVFIVFSSVAIAFPEPVGFANDFANVLPDSQYMNRVLSDYEKNTTIEIAVVTISALPEDQSAATYAVELFQEWGIGKKGEDNGILVLIVKNGTTGNRLRIELGYGIQGYVTGAEAGRILDQALPYYSQGDYQKTVEIIIAGLQEQLESYQPGAEAAELPDVSSVAVSLFPLIAVVIFIASVAMHSNRCPRCKSRDIKCTDDFCICQHCGKKFRRKRSSAPIIVAGGFGGGGIGGGGFGGGSSGGGGAGRALPKKCLLSSSVTITGNP